MKGKKTIKIICHKHSNSQVPLMHSKTIIPSKTETSKTIQHIKTRNKNMHQRSSTAMHIATLSSNEIEPTLSQLNSPLYDSNQATDNTIIKAHKIVNSISSHNDISHSTPIKKKVKKLQLQFNTTSILNKSNRLLLNKKLFHIMNEPQRTIIGNKQFYEYEKEFNAMKAQKERNIPKIKTKKGMNNFIIRDSRFISDPREYIIRSKYNQKVSDEYFQKKKRLEIEQIKINSEKFYKLKNKNPYEEERYSKEKRKCNIKIDGYEDLERRYKQTKEKYLTLFDKKNKEQGKILAELILNMEKGDPEESIDEEDLMGPPIILLENLKNTIYLKKILKKKNLEVDEDIGFNNAQLIKKELKEAEMKTMLALKGNDNPRFLKTHFTKNTQSKYFGLNGKYFGVAC